MKKHIICILFIVLTLVVVGAQTSQPTRAQRIVAELHKPVSGTVLVAAHRGDWRHYPENSLAAIRSAVDMGADIVELDIALTSDSVLVVSHDRTLDRTTNGSGKISDHTYAEISALFLKDSDGNLTDCRMPTLYDALAVCKDRAVVNIDKGYDFYDLALTVTDALGVTGETLIKGVRMPGEVGAKFASHSGNMLYMPVINAANLSLYEAYVRDGIVPMAYELCWKERTPAVDEMMRAMVASGAKLWVNTLWPSLNGGLCDEAAFAGNPDDVYGKIIADGATIIQSDRPAFLLGYLRSRGMHE